MPNNQVVSNTYKKCFCLLTSVQKSAKCYIILFTYRFVIGVEE